MRSTCRRVRARAWRHRADAAWPSKGLPPRVDEVLVGDVHRVQCADAGRRRIGRLEQVAGEDVDVLFAGRRVERAALDRVVRDLDLDDVVARGQRLGARARGAPGRASRLAGRCARRRPGVAEAVVAVHRAEEVRVGVGRVERVVATELDAHHRRLDAVDRIAERVGRARERLLADERVAGDGAGGAVLGPLPRLGLVAVDPVAERVASRPQRARSRPGSSSPPEWSRHRRPA